MINRSFIISTYQIGFVSSNISFNLSIINIFKTRNDVFIYVPGIGQVFLQEIKRPRFQKQ